MERTNFVQKISCKSMVQLDTNIMVGVANFKVCLLLALLIPFAQTKDECIPNIKICLWKESTLQADCSFRNLQVPPCFLEKSNITHLNLAHNRFDHVPDNLPQNLTWLDLSFNKLHQLINLHKYRQLNHLNLDNNQINVSFLPNMRGMPNLRYLSLKHNINCMQKLYPLGIFDGCKSLFHLRIDGCENGNFGDMFSDQKIETLKILEASGYDGVCRIKSLISHVFDKFNLTHLDLSLCDITNIEIGSLASQTHLQYLDMSYNSRLGFRGFGNISYDLQNSTIKVLRLVKIHCTFGLGTILLRNHTKYLNKTSLEELYLDSNRLEMIETGLITYNLPKSLKHLSVGDNKMDNGMYVLETGSLHNLQTLNVSFQTHSHNDYFDGCSDYTESCHNRPELTASTQNIAKVMESDGMLKLQKPPIFTFYLPKNMHTLYANDMKLTYPVYELHFGHCNLKHMHFQNNFILKFNGPIFGSHNITYIDVSNNFCADISTQALNGFPRLEILNFSQNLLGHSFERDSNGEILRKNGNLTVLNLHDNKITFLPRRVFRNNLRIKLLNISYNRMEKWTVDISHMYLLEHLDMSYNLLTELDEQAINLLPLHETFTINFLGNPLSCSCENTFFFQWMNRYHQSRFTHLENITCAYKNGSLLSLQGLPSIVQILQKDCSTYSLVIIVTSSFICLVFSLIVYRIIYRYRWKILYIYYLTKRVLFPELEKTKKRVNYEYDAFISYAEEDRSFVLNEIQRRMESYELRLCIHDRDFLPGIDIAENITNAIHNSRRIVFVMTSHFLKSHWCMFEFNMARMESIYSRGGENILLLILLEKNVVREMPMSLLHVVENESYLEFPDEGISQCMEVFRKNLKDAIKNN
ncbi:toll-like receptor 4 [Ostrea edulis]|uniref:toll-like receptor 4 n=1 Tax=Ostrea edulis TaxID=37623 RepID=UPI0024AEB2EF|nr:toll-like receptor 4 [Ostrea edulis]XP_056012284.1 toll-like receptor 4 [Ostrea edulis]